MHISWKSCTKNETFLASIQNLAKKLSCNFLQDSCKIFHILREKVHFSARLARFSARSCKSCKKILARFVFLQDSFYWVFRSFVQAQMLTWINNQWKWHFSISIISLAIYIMWVFVIWTTNLITRVPVYIRT